MEQFDTHRLRHAQTASSQHQPPHSSERTDPVKQLLHKLLQNSSSRECLLLALLVGYAALRLFWVSTLPLIGAEAYYWEWSENLAWGYFDHPPMIAGLLALSTAIGGDSVFWVRLVPAILGVLTTLVLYRLGKEMFGALTALLACAILQFLPFFAAASSLATPDAPLVFFWILTVYSVHRATAYEAPRWWLAAGAALGLDLMSKYHAILLVPAVFLYLLSSPKLRSWLFRKEPYLALGVALLVFSPNLVWNLSRGLQTFEFLLVERNGTPQISLGHFLHFLGGILLLLSPLFALLVLSSIPALARKARDDARYALLCSTSLFPVAFFGILSPLISVGGHWPAVGYTTFCLLGVAYLLESGPAPFGKLLRPIPLASIGFSVALVLSVYVTLLVLAQMPQLGGAPKREHETSRIREGFATLHEELTGWNDLGAEVDRAIAAMPNPTRTFVITDTYRLASQIRFLTHSKYPTQITGTSPLHQYKLWKDRIDLTGWDAVFVSKKSRKKNTAALEAIFTQVDSIEEFAVVIEGTPLRSFYLQRCYTAKFTPGERNPIAITPLLATDPQEQFESPAADTAALAHDGARNAKGTKGAQP